MIEPIIISSSQLSTYVDCKKRYQLGYEMMLEPKQGSGTPMSQGTAFHKVAEWSTRQRYEHIRARSTPEQLQRPDVPQEAWDLYDAWWTNVGAAKEASKRRVLGVEHAVYTLLDLQTGIPDQKVYLRCTFDQIYLDFQGWIVGMDYKTFKVKKEWEVDLDFQGRIYIAALQLLFPDYDVRFEYERVRQSPPGTPRGASENLRFEGGEWWQYNPAGTKRKRAELWTPEECYFKTDLVANPQEVLTLWDETLFNVNELLVRKNVAAVGQFKGVWSRTTNKQVCDMCYFKDLCISDLVGTLDEGTIDMLANRREPLTTPPELLPQVIESSNSNEEVAQEESQ